MIQSYVIRCRIWPPHASKQLGRNDFKCKKCRKLLTFCFSGTVTNLLSKITEINDQDIVTQKSFMSSVHCVSFSSKSNTATCQLQMTDDSRSPETLIPKRHSPILVTDPEEAQVLVDQFQRSFTKTISRLRDSSYGDRPRAFGPCTV